MNDGVSIIIPTYNGGDLFVRCLEGIKKQNYAGNVELIVVDSGSSDDSVEVARRFGATVSCIPSETFHHARTRNKSLSQAHFDKIVYFVQDAIPESTQWLQQLCTAIDQRDVAAVSVRQIPHVDADISARFETEFHSEYLGEAPIIKRIAAGCSLSELSYCEALHLIRHDNVCAIYRREALKCHPFPDIEFAEDMAWAHQALSGGCSVLYDPRIVVRHSHNRPPEYRFKRSIVECIACAKILKRVQEDTSALSVENILELHQMLLRFSQKFKESLADSDTNDSVTFGKGFHALPPGVLSLAKKLSHVVFKTIRSHRPSVVLLFQKRYCEHIRYIFSMIQARYAIPSPAERDYCVDQITATTLGRIHGEYYASFMLKGEVPDKVCNLVHPYLTGV